MLASHIGHTADIPTRSLSLLKEADLLIFEEDRPARLALKSAQVHREYLKFSEHLQKETLEQLKQCLKEGKTAAYMSDQGCPSLADPGSDILKAALAIGAQIKVIPGPSSVTAAISACPIRMDSYYYLGFLPRDKDFRSKTLQKAAKRKEAIVILDTPYRLQNLLEQCSHSFSKNTRAFLAQIGRAHV